jgi:hypothetical protein
VPEKSNAGRELGKLGASKGGKARANVLSPAERSEIAQRASRARWDKEGKQPPDDNEASAPPSGPPESTTGGAADGSPYSMFRGSLTIGDITFECHVLSDGRRVLTQREMVRVISGGRDSSNLVRYLGRHPLFGPEQLEGRIIPFAQPGLAQTSHGYEATVLVEICDAYLQARDEKLLKTSQFGLAKTAEVVMRACAKVGIIALVDEATGYQAVRHKQALQLKLQAFIADEMADWARMFPDEFWFELARLEGIRYSPRNRPLRWGKYVMAFVYDAVDSDVGKELRKKNPDPHFRKNHHQWLKQHGREKVNDQIQRVIAVMKLCDDMPDFRRKFAKVFQKGPLQLTIDGMDWPE